MITDCKIKQQKKNPRSKKPDMYAVHITEDFVVDDDVTFSGTKEELLSVANAILMNFDALIPGAVKEMIARIEKQHDEDKEKISRLHARILELKREAGLVIDCDEPEDEEDAPVESKVHSVNGLVGHVALHASNIPGLSRVALTGDHNDLVHRPEPARQWRMQNGKPAFKVGDRVEHPKRGGGCIVKLEGYGPERRALVKFDNTPVPAWYMIDVSPLTHEPQPVTQDDTLVFDEDDSEDNTSMRLTYNLAGESKVHSFIARSFGTMLAEGTETPAFVDIRVTRKASDGEMVDSLVRFLDPGFEQRIKECVEQSIPYCTLTSMVKES